MEARKKKHVKTQQLLPTEKKSTPKKNEPILATLISSSLDPFLPGAEDVLAPSFSISPLIQSGDLLGELNTSTSKDTASNYWGLLTIKVPKAPIKKQEMEKEPARKPRHVWFNLDKSSSMAGKKIQMAKEAIIALINNTFLQDTDRITIYAFNAHNAPICEYIEVAEFRKKDSAARLAFNNLTAGGGTLIGAGFQAFSQSSKISALSKEEKGKFQLISMTMTDGQCNKPETTDGIVKAFFEANPGLISYGIGIGDDYNPEAVKALNLNVELPAVIHIQDENDMDDKFKFIGHSIKSIKTIPVSLSLTFHGQTVAIPIKQVKPGEEYTCMFNVREPRSPIELDTINIHCEYLNEPQATFDFQAFAVVSAEPNYELLNIYANKRAKEILDLTSAGSELYKAINQRILLMDPEKHFNENKTFCQAMETIYGYSVELRHLHDMLASQPDEVLTETINALVDLISYLTNLCQQPLNNYARYSQNDFSRIAHAITWHPGITSASQRTLRIKPAERDTGKTTNNSVNTFAMSAGGLSKTSRALYTGKHENRTVAQEQQFQRLQTGGQFKKTPDGWVAKLVMDYSPLKYIVLNRTVDFSNVSSLCVEHGNKVAGILSLDGSLEKREGVVLDYDSYSSIRDRFHHTDNLPQTASALVDHLITLTRKNTPLVETAKDKELLDFTAFNTKSGAKVTLESGRDIPCIPLHQFAVGKCRHLVLDLAASMGIMVELKKLAPGPVNVFRYTAYNQQAHAWVMYEPSNKELYLIDPTLPQGNNQFNLRTEKGLINAINTYNAIGLNGLLADVIKHYDLKPVIGDEKYNALFDVNRIHPAIVEQFDEDNDFAFARSYLSHQVASEPVRLLLQDTASGKFVESKEIYEKSEIKAYIKEQKNNPFYPTNEAFDPTGAARKIVKVVPADDVRHRLLTLIVEKSMVAKPEEFSGNLMTLESTKRRDFRFHCALQKAKEVLSRPLHAEATCSEKEAITKTNIKEECSGNLLMQESTKRRDFRLNCAIQKAREVSAKASSSHTQASQPSVPSQSTTSGSLFSFIQEGLSLWSSVPNNNRQQSTAPQQTGVPPSSSTPAKKSH